jgi:antibiotic biosynthesis monooxygenase (ABM) superfamily enzyme
MAAAASHPAGRVVMVIALMWLILPLLTRLVRSWMFR